jgi:hypothetical protein
MGKRPGALLGGPGTSDLGKNGPLIYADFVARMSADKTEIRSKRSARICVEISGDQMI